MNIASWSNVPARFGAPTAEATEIAGHSPALTIDQGVRM